MKILIYLGDTYTLYVVSSLCITRFLIGILGVDSRD